MRRMKQIDDCHMERQVDRTFHFDGEYDCKTRVLPAQLPKCLDSQAVDEMNSNTPRRLLEQQVASFVLKDCPSLSQDRIAGCGNDRQRQIVLARQTVAL